MIFIKIIYLFLYQLYEFYDGLYKLLNYNDLYIYKSLKSTKTWIFHYN